MWAALAPYYDVIYGWKNYREESERITELIRKHGRTAGRTILDVACGTGGHSEHLQKRFDVTGIDLNPEMLKVARKRVPEISFKRADMTSFDLGRQFDAIVCLFSSIAYLRNYRNLKRAVRCFGQHLKPGGVLIIEPFFTRDTFTVGTIHGGTMEGDGVKISRHNVSRRRGDLAILDFHYLPSTKSGVQHFNDLHELALFDTDGFLEILEEAGLRSRFYKNGLMKGRGLYVSVKKGVV